VTQTKPKNDMRRINLNLAISLLKSVLALLCLLALFVVGWVGYTTWAKSGRETLNPEQIESGYGRWIQMQDARVHIQVWGDPRAPVVLLVHRTGAWSGPWFGLPAALSAAGWRVVAMDLPPFGLSSTDASAGDFTRAAQARRILELAGSLRVPVALVGHSFGAGPSLEAAMLSSEQGGPISQLVLVDAALGLGDQGEEPKCSAVAPSSLLAPSGVREALVAATATWPGLTSTMLKSFVHQKQVVGEDLLPAYRAPFAKKRYSADLGDWAWAFASSACEDARSLKADNIKAWAKNVGYPVDLIWGEKDEITPVAQAQELMRWMPNAHLRMLAEVGHIPHIEDPKAFGSELLAALKKPKSKQAKVER
jgi:pimeloyl-ACP methyl ester carboxylesterase